MARPKKEKVAKYYEAKEIETEVGKIIGAYPDKFSHFAIGDLQILFRSGKNTDGKKHVTVKIIKEPVTFLTHKKAMLFVTDGWWNDEIDSVRTKGLIEGLLAITLDDAGNLSKRPFDITTFAEISKNWVAFKKLLPAEKEDLVLSN